VRAAFHASGLSCARALRGPPALRCLWMEGEVGRYNLVAGVQRERRGLFCVPLGWVWKGGVGDRPQSG
jgi:hypothetical protein